MRRISIAFAVGCFVTQMASAADWPTWRADSARAGYTVDALPTEMSRLWSWHPLHAPKPAWPRDDRMSFDWAHQVVVADGLVCFGSSADGKVAAIDAETGILKWSFFTGGPVRFAPTVWKERL
ncbi:MAG TPA: PQQ-binding-like beta-propeller repeat protein, partial [Pirellulaceae bacterium]|nr:PQQ-binding-like beta-propeller repeat protein [Pirellulaceae bacterium]